MSVNGQHGNLFGAAPNAGDRGFRSLSLALATTVLATLICVLVDVGVLRVRIAFLFAGLILLPPLRTLHGRDRFLLLTLLATPAAFLLISWLFATPNLPPFGQTIRTAGLLSYLSFSLITKAGLGLAVFLAWVPLSRRLPGREPSVALLMATIGICVVAFFGLSIALQRGYGFVVDENLYLQQAHALADGSLGIPVDSLLSRGLKLRQSFVRDGFLMSQYPPIWPGVLAVFDVVGLKAFAGPITGGAVLVAMACLTSAIATRRAAIMAVLFLSVNPAALQQFTSFFSHAFTAAAVLAAMVCLSQIRAPHQQSCFPLAALAGLFLSLAACARPLTGGTLAVGVGLWHWNRTGSSTRGVWKVVSAMTLGAIPPLVGLLAHNAATTGSPLTFGYDLAHAGLQGLGFGLRGQVASDLLGREMRSDFFFTPAAGVAQSAYVWGHFLYSMTPGFLIGPVLWAGARHGVLPKPMAVLPFLAMPVAYVFYYHSAPRLLFELLPLVAVGTAVLVSRLERRTRLSLALPVAAVLVFAGSSTIPEYWSKWGAQTSRLEYFDEIERLRLERGPLLVLVRGGEPGVADPALEALWWYNTGGFPSNVVVLRDIPQGEIEFTDRFPLRTVVHVRMDWVSEDGSWAPPLIQVPVLERQ